MAETAALPFAAVAAVSSLAAGGKQRQSYREQAMAAEYNARNLETMATQQSAERRRELNQSLATIDVVRAHRNVASGSPSELAFKREFRKRSAEAENAEVLQTRFGIVNQRLQARSFKNAGAAAMLAGIGNATTSLASAFPASGGS